MFHFIARVHGLVISIREPIPKTAGGFSTALTDLRKSDNAARVVFVVPLISRQTVDKISNKVP